MKHKQPLLLNNSPLFKIFVAPPPQNTPCRYDNTPDFCYNASMTQKSASTHWFRSAKETSIAAKDNFVIKHYDWSLFLWHLTIEKTLKGIIAKKSMISPPSHDLEKLAKHARISIPNTYRMALHEITTYNIEARYDDYKRRFYKKATKTYTARWTNICQEIYL